MMTILRRSVLSTGLPFGLQATATFGQFLKKKTWRTLGIALALCMCMASVSQATNYYINGLTGSDSYNGLTEATAKKTFAWFTYKTTFGPGDTIFVMNGTYTSSSGMAILAFRSSGSAAKPIVITNYPGHAPLLQMGETHWHAIHLGDSIHHVVINGLRIRGIASSISLSDATIQPGSCANRTGSPQPKYNGNGITIDGRTNNKLVHHITVKNCEIFECCGGGLVSLCGDYLTYENNTIYNTSWYTIYGSSGISNLTPKNYDNHSSGGYAMIIRNNVVYGNELFVLWAGTNFSICKIYDGNGIILDSQNQYSYSGKTLVENNVVHHNGGRGIHMLNSDNIDVINNTCFMNGRTPSISGEITIQGTSRNVKVFNNIMYARTGKEANLYDSKATGFSSGNNMIFNASGSKIQFTNSTDIVGFDPLFADTSLNSGNFSIDITSRAVNAGTSVAGLFSTSDIAGQARPIGTRPDIGAYEHASGAQKVDQTITYNAFPSKKIGDADFNPGAVASSGLPITYSSSNTSVAVIVNGQVQIVGAGTTTIVASQAGNASYNGVDARQNLTVLGENLLANGSFNENTTGWVLGKSAGANASFESIAQTGYTSNVCKSTISSLGTGTPSSWNLQLYYPVPLIKGRTYSIKFRASADSTRTIDLTCQQNVSPWARNFIRYSISISKIPTTYGPYTFTAPADDPSNVLKFLIGVSAKTIYIDDVEVTVSSVPEMNVKQGTMDILANTGSFVFDSVQIGSSKTTVFTISNSGNRTLNLTNVPRVTVSGNGFSLARDAAQIVNSGDSTTFEVTFTPLVTGTFNGSVSIANSDGNENPYNLAITATGIKADQTITFDALSPKVYGDADFALGASASSGLPVYYTSSDTTIALIANGNVHIVGAGSSTITAYQPGDTTFNAATASQVLNVAKADQTITFSSLPAKVYGDANLALTATASSGLPVSYESSNTSVATIVNGSVHIIAAGTTTITALQEGNANYNAAIAVSQPFTVTPMTLEAEDAYLHLGKVFSNKPGFTGTGFVGHLTPFKGYIEWTVNAPETGMYQLDFRHSLGASARVLKLDVNGATVVSSLIFPSTGGWETWQTVSVVANLNAGTNTVRTTATLASVPNIDNLTIAKSSETVQSTTSSELMDLLKNWVVFAYPNPASDVFKIEVPAAIGEQIKVCLYSLSGRIVAENIFTAPQTGKNIFEIDVNNLQQGMYLVKVTTEKDSKSGLVLVRR